MITTQELHRRYKDSSIVSDQVWCSNCQTYHDKQTAESEENQKLIWCTNCKKYHAPNADDKQLLPELPEVHTVVNSLKKQLKGKIFSDINILWPKTAYNLNSKDAKIFILSIFGANF